MRTQEVSRFKSFVDRKLTERGASPENQRESEAAMKGCVMANKMIKAYRVIYGKDA